MGQESEQALRARAKKDLAKAERLRYNAAAKKRRAAADDAVGKILAYFKQVPRTEAAFYIEFQALPVVDIQRLIELYCVNSEWRAFTALCREFGVHLDFRRSKHRRPPGEPG